MARRTPGSTSAAAITYKFLSEEHAALRFRLAQVDVSVVNAIRRTLLTDIPIYVMRESDILVNTGRLTNEIIKHRLSLVPVHSQDLSDDMDMEVNVQADDTIRIVTTEDFRLRQNKTTILPTAMSQQVFPKNAQTQHFIEFARLRPKLGNSIPGEQLHLVARFSKSTARVDGAFNVVSKCAFQNTPSDNIGEAWEKELAGLKEHSAEEIASRKKDFMCLDAQRHFVPNSFDFVVETIGVYRNEELLEKACSVLQEKLLALYDGVRDHRVFVRRSEKVSMEHCFDVTLMQEDYTLGNLLAHLLLETFYEDKGKARLSFCGFQKEHPHDDDSTLRLAFEDEVDDAKVRECLGVVCNEGHAIFEKIGQFFRK